jgi:hypothetical protein
MSSNKGQPYQHGDSTFKQDVDSGTSMASPQIAGMCALYLQKNKTATPADVKKWIKDTSIKGLLQDNAKGSLTAYSDYYSLLGSNTGIAFQNLQAPLGTYSYIKDDTNTWRQARAVYVKHSDGTWKQARVGWIKTNTGWQKTYQL